MTPIHWHPWGTDAFVRARDERKPVLLAIVTTWSAACRAMDETTWADGAIAATINDRFVPLRVDADERPDISDRYALGGWPTTAFLTADGEILGGGTFVDHVRMPGVLAKVLKSHPAAEGQAAAAAVEPSGARTAVSPAGLRDVIFAAVDRTHGGFGSAPKFPLTAPLHVMLDEWEGSHDPELEGIVVHALDAMGWGPLYDVVDGGFFHYAESADWQAPHTEKLLDTNAALIRLLLRAGAGLGHARFIERAADALRYVQAWLADPDDGGWFSSQASDGAYYAAGRGGDQRAAPTVSARQLADANAAMLSAALDAARAFDDPGLRQFALTSLERVLLSGYRPGAGAAHHLDGVRGLLLDQAAMLAACLDAFEATGNVVYEMMSEELAAYAIRAMWDGEGGGFFDREDEGERAIGLMRRRLKPFVVNCDMARALSRVARTSGEPSFAEYADRTLSAVAGVAAAHGPLAAHYLLAMREASVR